MFSGQEIMSERRYLVTGGAGFIGSHLTETLLRQGHRVHVLDDCSTGRAQNLSAVRRHPHLQWTQGSVLDADLVRDAVRQADVVCHLAAVLGVRNIVQRPLDGLKVNVRGTQIVLDEAARFGKQVFLASSSEVYGQAGEGPLREDMPSVIGATSTARWSYAHSKALNEHYALAQHVTCGLPVVIARFFNTVGPRQTGRYGMVLPRFVRAARQGKPLFVHGDGQQTRTFTYVADAVRASLALLDCPAANGEVINIGGREEIKILDLARRVVQKTGSPSKIKLVDYAEAYGDGFEDIRRRIPCLDKIRKLIRFEPRFSLDQTLQCIITEAWRKSPAAIR